MDGSGSVTPFAAQFGEAGDRCLVLLHGFGGTHSVWLPVIERLRQSAPDLTILAYDLPGHGGSLAMADAVQPKRAAAAIAGDLDQRGISRFHLAGHSMGGAIATLLAASSPDRIRSLGLVAPGGFGPEIDIAGLKVFASAMDASSLRRCVQGMSAPLAEIPQSEIDALAVMRARPGQPEMLEQIANGMTRDGKQGQLPMEWLEGLAMPVSMIWGTQDSVLPYRQTQNIPPSFGLHTIAGAGHMLPQERPDIVARILYQLIR